MNYEIIIFTKDNCPYCDSAKSFLQQKGLDYVTFKIGEDIERDKFLELYPMARTVPWIMVDGDPIGGYENLTKYKFKYEKEM